VRANFLVQIVWFLTQWVLRILMVVGASNAVAVDFTVPVPSQSVLAPYLLETSLRTQSSEFLFLGQSDLSSAYSFAKLNPQTGDIEGEVRRVPITYLLQAKVLATRDGGFVRAAMSNSTPFGRTFLQKFDAHGQLLASKTEFVANGYFDLIEAADGSIVFFFCNFGNDNVQAIYVDFSAAQNVPSPRRYFFELCPANATSTDCALSIATPHTNSAQASRRSTLTIVRKERLNFEENRWTLLSLSTAGKLLRSADLGRFPSTQRAELFLNAQGGLLQVFDGDPKIVEYRFFGLDNVELWRMSTRHLPEIVRNDVSQANASGITLFARAAMRLMRVRSDAVVLWQMQPEQERESWNIYDLKIGEDGSAIFSGNRFRDYPAIFWRWVRDDGSAVVLPGGLRALGFAAGGGAFGLVLNPPRYAYSSAALQLPAPTAEQSQPQSQSLWRFNTQGLVQSQKPIANFALPPNTVQLRSNRFGGVDLAATYANQNVAAISRTDATGQVSTQFKLALQGKLQMVSADQLYFRTLFNTLSRVGMDGTVLWDRSYFSGLNNFNFLTTSHGVAAITAAVIRTVDASGNLIDQLNLSTQDNTPLECFRTDVRRSADQLRCLYRARADSPIEIYGIDDALQINLRHVLFRSEPVLSIAPDGDLLVIESPAQLLRLSANGQLRWRTPLLSSGAYPVAVATASGGAWKREFDGEGNAVFSYIDAAGVSTTASPQEQPVLGTAALGDSSLLVASSGSVERLQPVNGSIRITRKAIAADRIFNGDLSAEGMRATWRERSLDGSNGAFVSVYDWSLR
jgi:hypothetical protein